jgi:hypothetical protein
VKGFEFRETMAGSYHLLSAPDNERPISFTIRARADRMLAFLKRREVTIEGAIDAEGFADHRRLQGTLGLDMIRTGTLPYAFHFTGNDGKRYLFEGKKTIVLHDFAASMSILPGAIRSESGEEVGRAVLRFDVRSDLVKFLKSFKRTG